MKNIFKATLMLGLASSMALTGCIDEVQPTDGVTQDQLDASVKAGQATIFAMPANMVEFTDISAGWHGNFGYPAMMQIRDRLLDEMVCAKTGTTYNQWALYEQSRFSKDYWMPQVVWNFYSGQILAANKALQAYPAEIESEEGKGARSIALAFRVMAMLDAARWFEFLPNEKTSSINDGKDVLKLTIPVVTENMTEEEARNNPRRHHDDMVKFLLEDLKYAEDNIDKAAAELKGELTLPNLAAVYGLYARVYMWDEDYENAKLYAQKAMDVSKKKCLTQAEWSDPKSGFNTLQNSSWFWGVQLTDETSAVLTGICNFVSMVSVETTFGYAGVGAGAYPAVGYSFYQRVNNNDFRKLSWCPPSADIANVMKIQLNRYSERADKVNFCRMFEYGPIKFRPVDGNISEPSVAAAGALPLMRYEEMKFIEIEATAHLNPAEGKTMLEDFMNTYRMTSGKYTCKPTDLDGVVEEIVFQKRVELWGEGQNFFDVKRLGYSVTRSYKNSNFYKDCQFNTNGRPAWFNMPFVAYEEMYNAGMRGYNNPDVDGLYKPVS